MQPDEQLPNGAMMDEFRQFFYPDSPTDSVLIRQLHGAEFGGQCPGWETVPNTCTCNCYACNFNCTGCWRFG